MPAFLIFLNMRSVQWLSRVQPKICADGVGKWEAAGTVRGREMAEKLRGVSRVQRLVREETRYAFEAVPDLQELAEAQGVSPVTDFDEVTSGASWPEGQSVDAFIAAATEARYEEDEPDC